jgi:hypothetical protein
MVAGEPVGPLTRVAVPVLPASSRSGSVGATAFAVASPALVTVIVTRKSSPGWTGVVWTTSAALSDGGACTVTVAGVAGVEVRGAPTLTSTQFTVAERARAPALAAEQVHVKTWLAGKFAIGVDGA